MKDPDLFFSHVNNTTSSGKSSRVVTYTVKSVTGYKHGVTQERTFRLFLSFCKIGNKHRQKKEEKSRRRNKERWRERRGTKRRKLMGHVGIGIQRLANAG